MAEAKVRLKRHVSRKVDNAMLEAILKDIEEGAPRNYAAEANGLHESTFHNLVAQGKVDIINNIDSMEASLVVSLRAIEMKEIKECRELVRFNEKGHDGAKWTLEHAYWRTFSNNAPAKELADEIERMQQLLKEQNDGKANDSKKKKDSKK